MIKGALFDLDGVIADTSVFHFKAWQQLIKDNFQLDLPVEIEEQTKGISRSDSLKVILKSLNLTVSKEIFQALLIEKNETYKTYLNNLNTTNILPGITEFISELKAQSIKLALASASLNGPAILEKLQLIDLFDAIVDPSTLTQGKPAPDIFQAAAKALNLSPTDCIGIEDAVAGVKAINQSGAFSVAVGNVTELSEADLIFEATDELDFKKIKQKFEVESN